MANVDIRSESLNSLTTLDSNDTILLLPADDSGVVFVSRGLARFITG